MLYDITVRIRHDYDPPAAAGRNLLRLMPADLPGRQRLVAGQIAASPAPAERTDRMDFFGNSVTELTFRSAAATAAFTLRARVERLAEGDTLDLSPPLAALQADLSQVRSLAPAAPHHFLGISPRVVPSDEIAGFARAEVGPTVLTTVVALGRALHRHIRFDPDATTVDTSPIEAFRLRRGVCQDLAHVMISGLRGLGIPAAYVSGFLRTVPPRGQPRLEGADAMHAWVRAWCGSETGWVEYDPTNAVAAGSGHIVVAYGRDYDDVAPVHGVLRLAGAQSAVHSVDTRAVGPGSPDNAL